MVILGGCVSYVAEEKTYVVVEIFVNTNIFIRSVLVCSTTIKSACNFAMRILGYLDRQTMILICGGPLKTQAPMILPFPSPPDSVKEPSI